MGLFLSRLYLRVLRRPPSSLDGVSDDVITLVISMGSARDLERVIAVRNRRICLISLRELWRRFLGSESISRWSLLSLERLDRREMLELIRATPGFVDRTFGCLPLEPLEYE